MLTEDELEAINAKIAQKGVRIAQASDPFKKTRQSTSDNQSPLGKPKRTHQEFEPYRFELLVDTQNDGKKPVYLGKFRRDSTFSASFADFQYMWHFSFFAGFFALQM